MDIPYQAIDLDSVKYQEGGLGAKIRAVLLDQLGSPTIPQIFIRGQHIGGATDLLALYSKGSLIELLAAQNVRVKEMPNDFEPMSLLPGWLHKR